MHTINSILPKILAFILYLVISINIHAQVYDTIFEDLADDISESAGEDIITNLDNDLPYNVNSLTDEQMAVLGLNNFQSFCLKEYIARSVQMFSLNELRFVSGFDEKTISHILPYLYVEHIEHLPKLNLDSIFSKSKNTLRFQFGKNFKDTYGYKRTDGKGYKGSSFTSSIRYQMKYYDRIELSFVADKDNYEPMYYKDKIYGYDHYSISFTIKDISKHFKQLTLGDFRINLGNGLAISQNFSLGYMSSFYGAKNTSNRITPFRSTTEYNYNRGIAMKWKFSNIEMIGFASYNKIDFNGKSIQETGYHRTEREILQKDSNSVMLYGANLAYTYKGITLGGNIIAYHYGDSIHKGNNKYQQWDFEGKDNSIVSLNAAYNIKRFLLFTEWAVSKNKGMAYLAGFQINLGYKSLFSIIYRDYAKCFQNYYADAIGYHSQNHNERGVYVDFSKYFSRDLSFYAAIDYYYFPEISYRANGSSKGYKVKMQLNYSPQYRHNITLYLRSNNHQYDYKTMFDTTLRNNIIIQPQIKYTYQMNNILSFETKLGYSHSFTPEGNNNFGYFALTEILIKKPQCPLSIDLRYTYFYTEDYDNRFYVYEHSLPLNYSSVMLYNRGHRFYLNISYTYKEKIAIYARYFLLRYINQEQISSGNNLINNPFQHGVGVQIKYLF